MIILLYILGAILWIAMALVPIYLICRDQGNVQTEDIICLFFALFTSPLYFFIWVFIYAIPRYGNRRWYTFPPRKP